jgi:adenylate cyclase
MFEYKSRLSSVESLFKKFISIFLIFIIIISTGVVLYMRQVHKNIAKDLASDVIVEINNSIIEKTTHFLMPAVLVAETSKLLSDSLVLDLSSQQQLEKYTETVLKPYPQFASFYFGDEHGNFVMTKRVKNGFSTKIVNANSNKTVFNVKDHSGSLIENRVEATVNYDPRERPWYIGAKEKGERFWTDVYIFFTGKQAGITASYPVYDSSNHFSGSFGVDIELSELSNFLTVNSIGKDGIVFIINEKNKLIAFPKGKSEFKPSSGKVLDIVSLNSSKIEKAMSKYRGTESQTFVFNDRGASFIGAISHFPESFDKDWRIVLIAPLSYFVNITTNPLLGVISFLALLILALAFSKWSSSMVEIPFSRALTLVKQFRAKDFKGRQEKTSIIEADELIENLHGLAKSLESNKHV